MFADETGEHIVNTPIGSPNIQKNLNMKILECGEEAVNVSLIKESFHHHRANKGSVKKSYKFDALNSDQVMSAQHSVAVREEFSKRAIKPAPMAKINSVSMRSKMN